MSVAHSEHGLELLTTLARRILSTGDVGGRLSSMHTWTGHRVDCAVVGVCCTLWTDTA